MFCNKCGFQLNGATVCARCGAGKEQSPQNTPPQQFTPPSNQYTPSQQPQQYAPPSNQYTPSQQPQQFTPPSNQYTPPQQPQQFTPPSNQYTPPQQPQQFTPPNAQPPKKKSKTPVFVAIAAVLVVTIGVLLAVMLPGNNNDAPDTTQRPDGNTIVTPETPPPSDVVLTGAQIFENTRLAVFRVATDFGDGLVPIGSGFFICSSGIAVTNHHVMSALGGLTNASIILDDNSVYTVTGYYSYDTGNDIAIIHVDGRGEDFLYFTIGDSDSVRIGDNIYAIGGPEGDPITFTGGMVSRIAYEPISTGIYTVEGLLQHEAAIYGGNSGGPLVNDRGHVVGINSFGHTIRASVQWAVPINRVIFPASGATINPLPVSAHTPTQITTPGQFSGYESYPSVPTFMSVSYNATFLFGGNAVDLTLDLDGLYSRTYVYDLEERHSNSDSYEYGGALLDNGFDWQGSYLDDDNDIWEYFYSSANNISVAYCYAQELELMIILIGTGNAYETIYGSSGSGTIPPAAPGYTRFPLVPDAGLLVPTAEFLDSGYLYEWGVERYVLGDNTYIVSDDYVYLYSFPKNRLEDSVPFYIQLLENGFEVIRETEYELDDRTVFAGLYLHPGTLLVVSSIYDYQSEEWIIAIEE